MLIKVEDIRKIYELGWEKLEVLKWVSLCIEKWEFVSIMGASGSGKSTLMNIIWMLDIPTSWKYYFNWKDVSSLNDNEQALVRRRNIGFIFQNYNLLKKTSAISQVMLPLMYQWIPYKERYKKALIALEKVGLKDQINKLPSEMSGWQQQRVAIARAIVTDPPLILWDEPTWALDSKTGEEVMWIIKKLNNEWITIVIITHSPEVNAYATRFINIKDWEIV